MFKDKVNSTSFTTQAADAFFTDKINNSIGQAVGDKFDTTLCATVRALFYKRMGETNFIDIRYQNINADENTIVRKGEKWQATSWFSDFSTLYDVRERCLLSRLLFVDVTANTDKGGRLGFETIEHYFLDPNIGERSTGWERLEKVSQFFVKSFRCLCYINRETKSTVYFIENMNLQKFHIMQATLLPALPWYFDASQGISEDEKNLLLSLQGKDSSKYIAAIEKLGEEYDFESEFVQKSLHEFSTYTNRSRINWLSSQITNYRSDVEHYNNSITSCLEAIRECSNELTGLRMNENDTTASNALIKFFQNNSGLVLVGADNNGNITFICKTFINSWESEETAERIVNDERSALYQGVRRGKVPMLDAKKLFTALFINKTIKLRSVGAFKIGTGDWSRPAISTYQYPVCYDTYYPNPHLQYHSCMSAWTQGMGEAFAEGDYTFPITACCCAAGNLSLNDSTVMGEMSEDLLCRDINRKYIELPDGKLSTILEAIEYIKGVENE